MAHSLAADVVPVANNINFNGGRYMAAKNLRECLTSFVATGVLNSVMSVFLGFEGVCILAYVRRCQPRGTWPRP